MTWVVLCFESLVKEQVPLLEICLIGKPIIGLASFHLDYFMHLYQLFIWKAELLSGKILRLLQFS